VVLGRGKAHRHEPAVFYATRMICIKKVPDKG